MPDEIKPQHLSDTIWFYEEPDGLHFVVEFRTPDGALVSGEQFHLAKRKLLNIAKRYSR